MLKLLQIFVISLLIAPQTTSPRVSGREANGLRGKVRTVRIEKAMTENALGQNKEGPRMLSVTQVYDAAGNLVEEADYLPGEMPDTKFTSVYNEQGQEIEHSYFVHDSLVYRWKVTSDSKGRIAVRVETWGDGRPRGKFGYKYDAKGNVAESIEYELSGDIKQKWKMSYDSKNNLIQRIELGEAGKVSGRYVYTYDANKNKTSEAHFYRSDRSMKSSKTTYKYDSKENLVEEATYFDGKLDRKKTYTYDNKNNKTEIIEYGNNGLIEKAISISYEEFDSAGNWTKALFSQSQPVKESDQSRPGLAIHRKLTYWDN